MAETDLYAPIKRFLEMQGYTVKAEVQSCDVVAVRGNEAPVIIELKTSLNMQLYYQAIDRLSLTDTVYAAVLRPKRGIPREAVKLCRRIGLGLIVVTDAGSVEVLADPTPYMPRRNSKRKTSLMREFSARAGDLNTGGSRGRKLMTAYRQDALRCAWWIHKNGSSRIRDIKSSTGVGRVAGILRDNVYTWFAREERGIYGLTDIGKKALFEHNDVLKALELR